MCCQKWPEKRMCVHAANSQVLNVFSYYFFIFCIHFLPVFYVRLLCHILIFDSDALTDFRIFLIIGELSREEDVLEWLVENKSTGDDEEVIEDVTAKTLDTLIGNIDNLAVLFCEYSHKDSHI